MVGTPAIWLVSLSKERNLDPDTNLDTHMRTQTQRRAPCEMDKCSCKPRNQGLTAPTEAEKSKQGAYSEYWRKHGPPDTFIPDFSPQNSERIYFSCFKPPGLCGILWQQPQETNAILKCWKETSRSFPAQHFRCMDEQTDETQLEESSCPRLPSKCVPKLGPISQSRAQKIPFLFVCFLSSSSSSHPQCCYHLLLLQERRRLQSLCFPVRRAVCFCWLCMKTARLLALRGNRLTRGVMWVVSTMTDGSRNSPGHSLAEWTRKPQHVKSI